MSFSWKLWITAIWWSARIKIAISGQFVFCEVKASTKVRLSQLRMSFLPLRRGPIVAMQSTTVSPSRKGREKALMAQARLSVLVDQGR